MYRIAICDNDSEELENLYEGVKEWQNRQSGELMEAPECFTDPEQLLLSCRLGAEYQLYLLDIMMPQISGIEIGRYIREHKPASEIIYATSSPDYALEAYAVNALRYLQKPVNRQELYAALDIVYTLYLAHPQCSITLYGKNGIRQVAVKDIMYIENNVRDMIYTLQENSQIRCSHRDCSFEDAVNPIIEAQGGFIQTHKSFFINMAYIRELQADYVQMDNGVMIPITRRRLTVTRNAYLDYISGKESDLWHR